MKPTIMLLIVLGSLVAGAGGGILANKLSEPPKAAPRLEFAQGEADTSAGEVRDPRVDDLQRELNRLSVKIENAQRVDTSKLDAALQKLEERTAQLEKGVVGGSTEPDATVETTELKATFKDLMKQHEEEERAADQLRREKQMAEMTDNRRKSIMTKLVESLNLTTEQQSKVEAAVTDYQTKRRDMWTRSMQAREKGEQFDWRTESQTIEKASQDSIRNTLLAGQATTFSELVGDGSIDDLGGDRGWGRGPGNNRNRDTRRQD